MQRPLLIFAAFFLVAVFSSCNNPMNNNYSPATYVNDINAIRESNKVNYEDIELLTRYIALSKIAGNDLAGRSYTEILEKIKGIRKENTDQNDRIAMEKEAARVRLGSYLSVNLSGKIFSKAKNKDCFIYTVTFQNPTPKNIKMVVGSISLNDLLDREIKNIPILLDEQLKANATINKSYTVDYNNSNEGDKNIRLKEMVDLRVHWNPLKIIFDDGTIAE